MLEDGDKVLIVHRRLFQHDEPRYFVGEVVAYDAGVAKVKGFSFVRNMTDGSVVRKDEPRTKILSILSGAFLVYQLPETTDVAAATFEAHDGELTLGDGNDLRMNMAELPHLGRI